MHDLLLQTELFAVHVLAKDQVDHGIHFSKTSIDGKNQFEDIPHVINDNVSFLSLMKKCKRINFIQRKEKNVFFIYSLFDELVVLYYLFNCKSLLSYFLSHHFFFIFSFIVLLQNLPIIENATAVLLCNYHSVTTIGNI